MPESQGASGSKAVQDFIDAVNNSPALMRKSREALDGSSDPAPFVALAKAEGFQFTVDDAREHFHRLFSTTRKPAELSDDELDRVAGGKGGGTILPEDDINQFQSAVNMMKSMTLKRPPGWTGFD